MLAVGYEALRRLVLTEEPDAAAASPGARLRGLLPLGGEPLDAQSGGHLERPARRHRRRLHDTGVLDDSSYAAAQARLLK